MKLQSFVGRRLGGLRNKRFTILFIRGCGVSICIIALLFNLYRLGIPGLWFDEAFSVELARQPLPLLIRITFGPEPNMELYYFLLHFWLAFCAWMGVPFTEFVVRLPSALFAAISTLLVFLLGKRFFDIGTGLVAALFFLLNIQQLTYAQQARSYSLQLLLLCIAWYALFSALVAEEKMPARRWWAGYTIAMLLAIYAHLFSVLILLAQAVAVIGIILLPNAWRERTRSRLSSFGICIGLIAVGCCFLVSAILSGSKTGWLPVPQWDDFYHLFDTISGHSLAYLVVYSLLCATSIGLLALGWLSCFHLLLQQKRYEWVKVALRWLPAQQTWPIIWSLCCWLILPIVMSYAISQTVLRLFSSRYLVTIVPPFFLLIGMCIARIPWRNMRVLTVLLCLSLAIPSVFYYYTNAQIEDWNSATRWVQTHYQDGDGLICYDNDPSQGCQISVEYYLQTYPTGAHFTTDTPGEFSWAQFGLDNSSAGYSAALSPTIIAQFAAHHKRFFYIVGRVPSPEDQQQVEQVEQWLSVQYHVIGQLVTPTVIVNFYSV